MNKLELWDFCSSGGLGRDEQSSSFWFFSYSGNLEIVQCDGEEMELSSLNSGSAPY